MAKRKRNNPQATAVKKQALPPAGIPSPPSDATTPFEPTNASSIVLPEDIEISVETLQTLARYPAIIKSKACKDLRTAVYGFRQACTTGLNAASEGNNLTARISGALTDGKYTDALILLAEMRIRKETPTLGALCRWVRTLDVVSGLSDPIKEISKPVLARSTKNLELLQVLDSILRVTGPTDTNPASVLGSSEPIALQEVWDLRDAKQTVRQTRASVLDKSIFTTCPNDLKSRFRIIETTAGPERKPPNLHPAVLFASIDDAIPLVKGTTKPECHNHPVVPNLRVIKDVLSAEECSSIIAAGESLEFLPDAPLRPEGEESSILAHNFYWVVDRAFHDKLWERVKSFVPEQVAGKQVRGINRRFRVYRYVPGAEYRCHIDGAWPPSGIDPKTDVYQYDSSPSNARQSSLFTFLIYLNDEFKGGETTFFIPSVREGVMNAYPVKPLQGSVAVFPHGEAQGALLHEGTGVVEGAKYVIRTDVEYEVTPAAAAVAAVV